MCWVINMKNNNFNINDLILAPNDLAKSCLEMIINGLTKNEKVVDTKEEALEIINDLITEIIEKMNGDEQ